MRLVSVLTDGGRCAGVLEEERVWVTAVPGLEIAIGGDLDLRAAEGRWLPRESVRLDAPLRPPVVFCLGQNYVDHLDEKAQVAVREPEFFLKAGQTVAAPAEPCVLDPAVTRKLDYETELGIVVGRAGRAIPAARALQHVTGYIVVNDVTARDRQVVPTGVGAYSYALGPGKNFDGATRLAPWMTTADEVGDPQALRLTTHVNGERRQANTTAAMIYGVAELIAFVSTLLTLQPGSVIATGTPGGTGWGQDAELGGTGISPDGCSPARYLAAGDVVESEIERVGSLVFEVAAATDGRA